MVANYYAAAAWKYEISLLEEYKWKNADGNVKHENVGKAYSWIMESLGLVIKSLYLVKLQILLYCILYACTKCEAPIFMFGNV